MGTSGLIYIIFNNKKYGVYNNCDSFPSYLGNRLFGELICLLNKNTIEEIKDKFENVVWINDDRKPTPEEIKKLERFTDLGVSTQSTSDWYCLLRLTQGSLMKLLDAGYAINCANMWANYTFEINFDTKLFSLIDSNIQFKLDNNLTNCKGFDENL